MLQIELVLPYCHHSQIPMNAFHPSYKRPNFSSDKSTRSQSSYPSGIFLGPFGTIHHNPVSKSLSSLRKVNLSPLVVLPPARDRRPLTRISQWYLLPWAVAKICPQRRHNNEEHGPHGSDAAGIEDGRLLVRRPAQVSNRIPEKVRRGHRCCLGGDNGI